MATESDMLDYLDYITQDIENVKSKTFVTAAMASHLRSAFPGVTDAEGIVDRWLNEVKGGEIE